MPEQIPLPLGLPPRTSFEHFWPGCNAEAVGHLQSIAKAGGEHYLYLWGAEGQGKSHLLQATCQLAYQMGHPVSYLPMRQLCVLGPGVFDGLETQDLVCIDDVDAIVGDIESEQSLFSLFNQLRERNGRLVISASVPPRRLQTRLADLGSRLTWGLVLRLHTLNDEDTIAAIDLYARRLGLELSPQVSHFLFAHCRRDFTSLRDLLERLDHATLAAKRRLTVPFLKSLLEELV
jgi:DnaA family protein